MEGDEVLEFAQSIGAHDLKGLLQSDPKYHRIQSLFRRRNYFALGKDTYLVIKISRSAKGFWGIGKQFVELFDTLTEEKGTYYLIALDSSISGWVLSKSQLKRGIKDGSISYSTVGSPAYKVHQTSFRHPDRFISVDGFRKKLGIDADGPNC